MPFNAVNRARRAGLRKGLTGGRRGWLAVGIAAWGIDKLRESNDPVLVAREELKPGQRLIISHGGNTIDIEEPAKGHHRKR